MLDESIGLQKRAVRLQKIASGIVFLALPACAAVYAFAKLAFG